MEDGAKVMERTNKFSAVRMVVDGIAFDSRAEARRYGELKLLERAKQIVGLAVHPRYALHVDGTLVGHYKPDFGYRESGRAVVEDVKSGPTRTESYVFRAKVFRACYPDIEFREIGPMTRRHPAGSAA